jgi:hypothetical protein
MSAPHVQESSANVITPFVSGHTRAQWVTAFLIITLILDLAGVFALLAQIDLLSRALGGQSITAMEATANDSRLQTIGALQVVVWLITAVLFLRWMHRAHRNLPALGARQLQYSPGWAVGGFFVPFLCLVRPFQVMREIWKASDPAVLDGAAWHDTDTSPLVGWWWALFLTAGFVTHFVGRMAAGGSHAEAFLTMSWWLVAANVLSALAAVLAMQVVRTIDRRQREKYRRLAACSVSPNNSPLV